MSKDFRCKLEFGKNNQLTKTGELCYAKSFFANNTIRRSELSYYAGQLKGKNPHGISRTVWKKAHSWAKKTGRLTVKN